VPGFARNSSSLSLASAGHPSEKRSAACTLRTCRHRTEQGARVASWSDQDLEDVFGLRLVVESYAARRAAERIHPADIAKMEALATEMEGISGDGRVTGWPRSPSSTTSSTR